MLVGQLTDLRETQSGKDLIKIGQMEGKIEGKVEGKVEGKIEGLVQMLEIRFGSIPQALKDQLTQIKSIAKIDELYRRALQVSALSEFQAD